MLRALQMALARRCPQTKLLRYRRPSVKTIRGVTKATGYYAVTNPMRRKTNTQCTALHTPGCCQSYGHSMGMSGTTINLDSEVTCSRKIG